MAVRILELKHESCPEARFIGKKYAISGNWEEWRTNNWFAELGSVTSLPINNNGYMGAMHVVNGMVEYWIGRFCPTGTPAPNGFEYIDIEPLEYAVFSLQGSDEKGETFSFATHNMCLHELESYGLKRKEDDWCFERHGCQKYDKNGNAIKEYAVSLER